VRATYGQRSVRATPLVIAERRETMRVFATSADAASGVVAIVQLAHVAAPALLFFGEDTALTLELSCRSADDCAIAEAMFGSARLLAESGGGDAGARDAGARDAGDARARDAAADAVR
jgi:hypothetical protein